MKKKKGTRPKKKPVIGKSQKVLDIRKKISKVEKFLSNPGKDRSKVDQSWKDLAQFRAELKKMEGKK